ncbi:phage major tail tube protein [Comamonas testosteroni]|uniref:Phage major tail tube protein n=1 Tax=Comamonas testosteroni TaxID=285 RepID=A0A373FPN8_COMTE|nr:phage major tail tube protein [Comamonas testosteroni]RGE46131.1 phage major tail tube protein [Comamonas testosteroni]
MGMPQILKHLNAFVDGTSYVGEVTEVALPKLNRKLEEFRSGGMRLPAKTDLGMEALEVELTAGGWLKDVLKQFGNAKVDGVALRLAGALQRDDTGDYTGVEVHLRGRWEEIDPGSFKPGDASEFKAKMALNYYRLVFDGEDVIEIDAINMIEKVGGTDLMATVRQLLGI